MSDITGPVRRLERFYGEMTSVDAVLRALAKDMAPDKVSAADLYTRSLDCQNHGGFEMLQRIAGLAAEHAGLDGTSQVLDAGCGIGGPGRYLADRFGCTVTGIDLLPERIRVAAALTRMVGLTDRVTYRRADATDLPFSDAAFDQVWMLDASVHVTDKRGLFLQLARVLKPRGLLVMHEQMGPLPAAMRYVTRRAPYICPSLPQVLRYIEGGGFHLLLWHDTTRTIFERMEDRREGLAKRAKEAVGADARRQQQRLALVKAYVDALSELGGSRTGILVARRVA